MHYRPFGKTGFEVSALGMGCMRLPTADGVPCSAAVDTHEAVRLIRAAVDGGVNYLDTAYPYHGGHSEEVVGLALKDGYREKTRIASKSPVFLMEQAEDFERILELQLKRLGVDCIDFYLLHALSLNTWTNRALKFDLLTKMDRARRQGKIRYLGFSYHDSGFEEFRTILDGWDQWDFCQIQLNYIDTQNQAGIQGLEYAASHGVGVVIMEPLLGGGLASPPEQVRRVLDRLEPAKAPVEWALDFLWDRPEVGVILSGMSTRAQLDQNLICAGQARPGMLNAGQHALFEQARTTFETMALVPCTRCTYCMPCPFGVDIPGVFDAYNQTVSRGDQAASERYAVLEGGASLCRACRRCEKACPQGIAVSERMPVIHEYFARLETADSDK
ncbi:MAG: aldo/keto reductase [Clostridiales bacterium]|nr:aldo/keto reductase [Clostridiales bacterium]